MSILDDYETIPIAKPGEFDWKKRLKEKRGRIAANKMLERLPRQDSEMDQFGSMSIGEGIKQIV